jgi:hypothetical protein
MFIDSDILALKDLNTYFKELNEYENIDILHVYKEKDDLSEHLSKFWSMHKYTEEDMAFFSKNQVYPFNAGCFAFKVNNNMKQHFTNIIQMINVSLEKGDLFFYEQAFMNVYFNTRNLVDYKIINKDNYVMFPDVNRLYPNTLIHFCGFPGNGVKKFNAMTDYISSFKLLE